MKRNKGLILDIDDAMYSTNDYLPNALKCAVKAMMEKGLPAKSSDESMDRLIEIRKHDPNSEYHLDLLCLAYEIEPTNELVQTGREAYRQTQYSLIKRREGLLDVIQKADQKKYRLMVVSNGLKGKQIKKLRLLGIYEHFVVRDPETKKKIDDYVFVSNEDGIRKPSSKLFDKAIEKTGIDPKRIIAVGNRLNDVIAANRADIGLVVLLRRGKYKGETPVSYLTRQGYSYEQIKNPDSVLKERLTEFISHLTIENFFQLLPHI